MVDPGGLSRAELIALVEVQAERIATQAERIATQAGQIVELTARLERLERLISRNSGNSSMPPSSDGGPGRPRPKKRGRSGGGDPTVARSKGKQPGAPGANLAWREHPDARVDRFPEDRCGCGAAASAGTDLGVVDAYQQTEIPVLSATVTQHDLHALRCVCGAVRTAARPPGAGTDAGRVGYGPNLRAWCVYLMVTHALPTHRVVALLESLTGARPSVGFVHSTLSTAAAVLAGVETAIRARIEAAPAVAVDETPVRVGPASPVEGRKKAEKYLITAATPTETWYHLGDRDLASFNDPVDRDGRGDRARPLRPLRPPSRREADPPTVLRAPAARPAKRRRDLPRPGVADPDRRRVARVDPPRQHCPRHRRPRDRHHDDRRGTARISARGEGRPVAGPPRPRPDRDHRTAPRPTAAEVLRDREDDVLRFTTDLRVPPTSNDAERAVRPAKTQQKISGRLTSEDRTRERYRIRGVLGTAAKHGADQLTVLRDAFTGRLWFPPTPSPA